MRLKIFGIKIEVTFFFVALIFFLLLSDTTGTVGLALPAALCHETGHIIAMKKENCAAESIVLSPIGASIVRKADPPTYKSERIVSFCGPLVNLLLCFISFLLWLVFEKQKLLLFCFINLFMGVFNLLPVASFDGSGILGSFLRERMSLERAETVSKRVSVCLLSFLLFLGLVFFCLPHKNPTLLITSLYMIILEFSQLKILKNR